MTQSKGGKEESSHLFGVKREEANTSFCPPPPNKMYIKSRFCDKRTKTNIYIKSIFNKIIYQSLQEQKKKII